MLGSDYGIPLLDRAIARLCCDIALPVGWDDFFDKHGPLPTDLRDRRQFPRFQFRRRGIVEYGQTAAIASLVRKELCRVVFTKDISRNGVAFLNAEQLYPLEEVVLWFADKPQPARVARCVRHNANCYEVGVTFATGGGFGSVTRAVRRSG